MRSKADQIEYDYRKKVASDFNWCIENDFQVYIKPDKFDSTNKGAPPFRICIRRGGITTEGKEFTYVDGVKFESTLTVGTIEYKTMAEASVAMDDVYEKLRKRYG